MVFFKKRFLQLREARGLTLDDVALACGCSKQTVQKWEKHPSLKPRPAKIPVLAKLLHCEESDLAKYGPFEKALDSVNEESAQLRNLLFGADVSEEVRQIRAALARRGELSKRDPNYETTFAEENAEIRDNLRLMFQKLCRCLNVADLPENALDDFRFGLLRSLIKSEMSPKDKETALKIVEKYGQES